MSVGWKLAAGLGAVLALIALAGWLYIKGRSDGRSLGAAEQAAAIAKAELERKGDNAKLQTLDDYDLCIAGLRGNGMPTHDCEQLRGL